MIFRVLLLSLLLTACQSNPKPAADDSLKSTTWQASTLSAATIGKANGAVKAYEKCLNEETPKRLNQDIDPRALGDQVLETCEMHLEGIRTAYRAEGVPDSISERYMRKTRSRGAQSLMRFLQMVYAQKAAAASSRTPQGNARQQRGPDSN